MFYENLLNGLTSSKIHYVRARFINIITISIYMLSEFLDENVLNENIKKILYTYFDIINNVDIQDIEQKKFDFEEEEMEV